MQVRPYSPEKDRAAAHRIWYEVGWLRDKSKAEAMDIFIEGGRALVADFDGEAECLAASMPGTMRYLDEDLPWSCVTAVTTSRVARKQGLAARLTAQLVAADAAEGALVAGLGIFEQGYYDRLGFGTGVYEHWLSFDPAQLAVDVTPRMPRRLTPDDWERVHAAFLARRRGHGSITVTPPEFTQGRILRIPGHTFGLGYEASPGGEITHHLWALAEGMNGPYFILWMTYQTRAQFLELMALLRGLGDQVRVVRMREPEDVQLQDLIRQPLRFRQLTRHADFENANHASAYLQMRICDLPGCLERTHLRSGEARFNLKLSDPITRFLDEGAPWRGTGGDYVVTLGPCSGAEPGTDPALPTLTASVGAFTRLWLGVRLATGLAFTDALSGPDALLETLDQVLCLPTPRTDWEI
ncbi:MAG: hypothetical protein Kow00120_24570 [Anaerolineae bacterium]